MEGINTLTGGAIFISCIMLIILLSLSGLPGIILNLVLKLKEKFIKKDVEYYVDFENGNDDYDGKHWFTAKKTVKAGLDAMPTFIPENTSINLTGGTITNCDDIVIDKEIGDGKTLTVGGGASDKIKY